MRSLLLLFFIAAFSVDAHWTMAANSTRLRHDRELHTRHGFDFPAQPDPSKPFAPDLFEQRKINDLIVDGVCRSSFFSGTHDGKSIAALVGCALPQGLVVESQGYRIRMPAKLAEQPLDKAELFERKAHTVFLIATSFQRPWTEEEIAKLRPDQQEKARAQLRNGVPANWSAFGSGVAIGGYQEQLVMTNCHVIDRARIGEPFESVAEIKVINRANTKRDARLIAAYSKVDLCILSVENAVILSPEDAAAKPNDPYRMDHLFYHNVDVSGIRLYYDLKVGEPVFAIGSPVPVPSEPDAVSWSFSEGIIAGLRDDTILGPNRRADVIQHTALTTHGSSGGALFDRFGNLIGITQGSYSEATPGFNIAIPADSLWVIYGTPP
ncbi:serine protease [Bradyrhizobium sp. INPA03-11B]|uniref:S1C family serine protease n=1 Tax=Bradyrhizobium sp. INPA03-11B TaxID=418598 RepID=UPI00338F977F